MKGGYTERIEKQADLLFGQFWDMVVERRRQMRQIRHATTNVGIERAIDFPKTALINSIPTQTLQQHLASLTTNFYCQHALPSIPNSPKLSVPPCRATEVLSQAREPQPLEEQSDRACGKNPLLISIQNGCEITVYKNQG